MVNCRISLELYHFEHESKIIKLRPAQLKKSSIAMIFGLLPDSVFLQCEDGSVELANEDRTFTNLKSYFKYEVQGHSLIPQNSTATIQSGANSGGAPGPSLSQIASTSAASYSITSAYPYQTRFKGISSKKCVWPAMKHHKPPAVSAQEHGQRITPEILQLSFGFNNTIGKYH